MASRHYLDNAATSWPKPEGVYDAVDRYQRGCGAAAGRGGYASADAAGQIVERARRRAATLLGAPDPKSIAFTQNGTDALNAAIHGLLRPGDHVVTTDAEHNSVLRPLRDAAVRLGCRITYVPCDAAGQLEARRVLAAVEPTTRLVVLTHASNVTGAVLPVEEVGAALRDGQTLLLVDAAQTLGHRRVDVGRIGADLLAAPGHKGLLAPLGVGLLWVGPRAAGQLRPTRQGGTGSVSESEEQPPPLPHRLEAGNLNVPAIVGLDAALGWIESQTVDAIGQRLAQQTARLIDGAQGLPGVRVLGPPAVEERAPVVSLLTEGYDPHEAAALLDSCFGVECRAGLHCAARIHGAIGALASGGTLRLSPGPLTTDHDIDAAIDALRQMTH
ncbi:putative cysteine desulfurase [Pirellulimonas nuda]|uniref:cysteine desulfurase n=1 Tax=Pirellulimonas nuda TaxID=2528009 RepID=A0A518DF86_9BACT|nr:aminotransferase class V-fold PLP-dependent enzyme [Pirellulimonas nuda]QDU90139.1 putative cysteine desulfurase [Pirellulimonas nuda]